MAAAFNHLGMVVNLLLHPVQSVFTEEALQMPVLARNSDPHFDGLPFFQNAHVERRISDRRLLCLPAWVIFYRASCEKRIIKIRNMTRRGMFFYSDLPLCTGETIEFVLRLPRWTRTAPVACRGVITRVETSKDGLRGAAVALDRCFVLK